MKRNPHIQAKVLQRIVDHEYSHFLYEVLSVGAEGYEDTETPKWSHDEAHHIELLILEGHLKKETILDAPWFGSAPEDSYSETYVYLTPEGYDWLENRGALRRFIKNVSSNIPTIITTVLISLISAYLLRTLGLEE